MRVFHSKYTWLYRDTGKEFDNMSQHIIKHGRFWGGSYRNFAIARKVILKKFQYSPNFSPEAYLFTFSPPNSKYLTYGAYRTEKSIFDMITRLEFEMLHES